MTASQEEYSYLEQLPGLVVDIQPAARDLQEWTKQCCTYIEEHYHSMDVGDEVQGKCNLFLIDYREFAEKENLVLSEINGISDYKGKVIIYHAPEEGLECHEFLLEEKFVIDGNNTIYLLENKKEYRLREEEKSR